MVLTNKAGHFCDIIGNIYTVRFSKAQLLNVLAVWEFVFVYEFIQHVCSHASLCGPICHL